MAHPEDRSSNNPGGIGSSEGLLVESPTLLDLRENGSERAIVDLRRPAPVITFEPVPEATIQRRWLLLASLAVLNALDLVTTRLVLDVGGTESNPLMAPIIHHPVAPILVKTVGILMVAGLLRACPPKSRLVDASLIGVTFGYLIVVCWNMLNLAPI
jgi:hypothetical protein